MFEGIAQAEDLVQNAAKQYRFVGSAELRKMADLFEIELDVLQAMYVRRLEGGMMLPPLVLDGGQDLMEKVANL